MFQRILVPLDGSVRAERALAVAARLARASLGTVTLVRVVSPPVNQAVSRLSSTVYALDRGETELARATRYLDYTAHSPVLHGLPVHKQALVGSVVGTLLSMAESSQSDLIVMCRHGDTGLPGWMLGSVSEKLAHRVTVPVLLLHEGGPIPASPLLDGSQPFCALVPLDETPSAQAAIGPAVQFVTALAESAKAKLHLLGVVPNSATEAQIHQAKISLAMTALHIHEEYAASAMKQFRLAASWSVAVSDDVAEAIVRTAETGEGIRGAGIFGRCDLIAMATHERVGLRRWAWGSVTGRMLHETRLPVLIVHPAEMAPELVEGQQAKATVQEFTH
jgi:nucleotide-binding universal stress UspA family protein